MRSERSPSDGASRREFLAVGTVAAVIPAVTSAAEPPSHRQASGVKVAEVTDTTAIVWVRLTERGTRNDDGTKIVGKSTKDDSPLADADVRNLQGGCPGATGRVRVRYGSKPGLGDANTTDWVEVTEKADFSHQFALTGLPADSVVHCAVDTTDPQKAPHGSLAGTFRTAPKPGTDAEVAFAVVTCQMYADLDHADGFQIYPATYAALFEGVDDSVGTVRKALADLKLDQNTIVVFTSDNGGLLPITANPPYRAGKG